MPFVTYIAAAVAEIAGCFAFWAWLRLGAPWWWALPGLAALLLFAVLLTQIDADAAGRTFAAYGGVYIATSLAWLWAMEGMRPDRWDLLGGAPFACSGRQSSSSGLAPPEDCSTRP